MDLLAAEVRVLGCLLEKQRTTPDAYPLSLNSLRLACNQSTNRDPVVDYSEAEVREALQRLERRGLVRFASGAGSRAAKFRHLLAERLPMDDAEQALMCVLMLRGPQTPGELKQRGERLHRFSGLAEVEATLQRLIARELVERQPRRPGQKEERYAQLLAAEGSEGGGAQIREPRPEAAVEASSEHGRPASAEPPADVEMLPAHRPTDDTAQGAVARESAGEGWSQELADLRARVARLEDELQGLKEELGVGASG